MKKTIFALLLVVALVAVLAIPAAAEGEYNPYHCICGAQQYATEDATTPIATATCLGDCDGKNHKWIPITESVLCNAEGKLVGGAYGNYTITDIKEDDLTLPTGETQKFTTEDLYVYLDKSFATADWVGASGITEVWGKTLILNPNQQFSAGTFKFAPDKSFGFHLDLNGNSIENNARVFRVDGSAENGVDFTLSDTKGGGKIDVSGSLNQNNTGIIARFNAADAASTLKIYGGTYDVYDVRTSVAQDKIADGGAFSLVGGSMYLYDGQIIGARRYEPANHIKLYGSAVYVNSSATFEMHGKSIINGSAAGDSTAVNGGAIYSKGTVKLYDNAVVYAGKLTATNSTACGGAIYIAGGTVDMYDNVELVNNLATSGGAVYVGGEGTFTMHGGKITLKAKATKGGAVYVDAGCTFNMQGDSVISGDGSTVNGTNGSAIFVQNSGIVNMSGNATIQNCVADNKAAVILHNDNGSATLIMSGNAKIINNKNTTAYGGGVHSNQGTNTIMLSGNAQIKGNTNKNGISNIYLADGAPIQIGEGGMGESAAVGVTMVTPGTFATGATNATDNFFSDNADYTVTDDGALAAVKAFEVNGTETNWSGVGSAAEAKLVADLYAEIPVGANMTLDLNGKDISRVNIAEGKTLKVFDSKTADFDVADGDYGVIKSVEGKGTLATDFVNGEKHRYLTLHEEGVGYSFHRFYLAVTKTFLRDGAKGLGFVTRLKTNTVMAGLIEDYGIQLKVGDGAKGTYSYEAAVEAGDNEKLVATTGLDGLEGEAVKTYMEATQTVNAYIKINGKTITSAAKTASVKESVEAILDTRWEGLTGAQKLTLQNLYTTYGADAGMDNWTNIDKVKSAV